MWFFAGKKTPKVILINKKFNCTKYKIFEYVILMNPLQLWNEKRNECSQFVASYKNCSNAIKEYMQNCQIWLNNSRNNCNIIVTEDISNTEIREDNRYGQIREHNYYSNIKSNAY